jgi:Na+-transporting NADH:ubiquinone oxidoreductase subunit NqrB
MTARNIIFALGVLFFFLPELGFSQANWNLGTIKTNINEGTSLITDTIVKSMGIVGLLAGAVCAYFVFAKGQNSWQYIGGFIICVIMLGTAIALFGNQ